MTLLDQLRGQHSSPSPENPAESTRRSFSGDTKQASSSPSEAADVKNQQPVPELDILDEPTLAYDNQSVTARSDTIRNGDAEDERSGLDGTSGREISQAPTTTGEQEPKPAPEPEQPRSLPLRQRVGLIAIVTFTMAMSAGGMQGLNVALPIMQEELGIAQSDLQWIASAYSLTNGCFLLLAGRLADVYGRKICFIIGIAWYAIWCLGGSFMHSGTGLIVTRALAGMGAAMGIPSSLGIIAANIHGKQRATAFALFAAGAPIGGGSGMVLGGVLAAYTPQTWRPVLWIFAGLAFVIVILGVYFVPRDIPVPGHDTRIDWVGAAFVTIGLVLLQFSVSDSASAPKGWRTPYIPVTFAIGAICLISFFFWEYHVIHQTSRPPLIRLALFTRAKGRLAAMYFVACVCWMGFVSTGFYATLFYQQVQMTGTVGAVLRFLPCPIMGLTCNLVISRLVHKLPMVVIVGIGLLSTCLSSTFLAVSKADTVYWTFPFNAMYLWVIGADFIMPTGSIFVSKLALPQEQSVAGALFQTLLQLGGSFGLTFSDVLSTSVRNRTLAHGAEYVDALLKGIQAAFWLSAAFAGAALIIAVITLRGVGIVSVYGDNKKKAPEANTDNSNMEANAKTGGSKAWLAA